MLKKIMIALLASMMLAGCTEETTTSSSSAFDPTPKTITEKVIVENIITE
jgi:uncharacterized lipoprotein YajG